MFTDWTDATPKVVSPVFSATRQPVSSKVSVRVSHESKLVILSSPATLLNVCRKLASIAKILNQISALRPDQPKGMG